MPVALRDGFEFGLVEGHPRLAVLLRERDGDERLVAAAAVVTVPRERVDEARRRHDFANDAALPKLASAVVLAQAGAPSAARPSILREMRRREAARPHPVLGMRGIRPQREDELARRVECARDREGAFRGIGLAPNFCVLAGMLLLLGLQGTQVLVERTR